MRDYLFLEKPDWWQDNTFITRCSFSVLFVNGRRFGNDSASCSSPVYHGPDDECTRQKPHKRLVATNRRIPHAPPPVFPPSVWKVLWSVCLRLGLDISSESSLRPPAFPPLSSFSSPLFDLLKPRSFIHSAAPPPSYTLAGCVYVCKSCNRANLIPPVLFSHPSPCVA